MKKGFTLVELVIVIAVIAILSAILIPTFSGILKRAKDSKSMTEATQARDEIIGSEDIYVHELKDYIIMVNDDYYVIGENGQLTKYEFSNEDISNGYQLSELTTNNYIVYKPIEIVVDNNAYTIEPGAYDNETLVYSWDELVSLNKVSLLWGENLRRVNFDSSYNTIVISDDIVQLNEAAFLNCANLETIYIPGSVTTIQKKIFEGCSNLETIVVHSSNTTFNSGENNDAVYLTSENKLVAATENTVISLSAKVIGPYAYWRRSMTSLTIPANIERIEGYGICDCQSLTEIVFESNSALETLEKDGFNYCHNLDTITFGANSGLKTIKRDFATSCSKIAHFDLGVNSVLETIEDNAFEGFSSLNDIALPETIISFGNNVFRSSYYNSSAYVSTENSVRYYACGTNAKHIAINKTNDYITTVASGTKVIASRCLTGLRSTTFTIPSSVITIGNGAFRTVTSLTNITFADSTNLKYIEKEAFYECRNITSVEIPEGVVLIGENAFAKMNNLQSVSFPSTLASLSSTAFSDDAKIDTITVDTDNEVFQSANNNVIETATNTLVLGASENIPSTVTKIGQYAYHSRNIANIVLPDSVVEVDDHAFENSTLTSVVMGESLVRIGESAFSTGSLVSIDFGNSHVVTLASYAFMGSNCASVITLPSTVEVIDNYAFMNTKITGINFPDSLTKIGVWAFCNSKITSVYIPEGLTNIERTPFFGVTTITSCEVHEDNIKYYSEDNCILQYEDNKVIYGAITATHIPEHAEIIGSSSFSGNTGISTLVIPSSITKIESNAFEYAHITSLSFECDSFIEIEGSAFNDCKYLTTITLPDEFERIEDSMFNGCDHLTTINFGSQIREIGRNAFSGCERLTTLELPDNIERIEDSAFARCYALSSISFNENLREIGCSAFEECSSLTTINLPEGLEKIDSSSFQRCNSLTSIYIPSTVTQIGNEAFRFEFDFLDDDHIITFTFGYNEDNHDAWEIEDFLRLEDVAEHVEMFGENTLTYIFVIALDGDQSYCDSLNDRINNYNEYNSDNLVFSVQGID